MTRFTLAVLLLGASAATFAHGGGLDAYGCHHDRQRGGYHCHQGVLAGRSFGSQSEAVARFGQAPSAQSALAPTRPGASLPPAVPPAASALEVTILQDRVTELEAQIRDLARRIAELEAVER